VSARLPGVAVAMCTYNGAAYLEAQFASIFAQTRLPDEVVVADDGSTDDTTQLLARLSAAAPMPVRVLASTNRLGVTANFERALAATRHELVVLSDQDDVWDADRVAISIATLESEPALLLVHTDARLVDRGGAPLGSNLLDALRVTGDERRDVASPPSAFRAHLRRNLATGATATIRASLLDLAGPFPASWVHDEWLTIIAASLGRARLIDRVTIDYRQHGSNEIGVALGGVRHRWGRILEPRGDRYPRLAARDAILVERLAMIDAPPAVQHLAHRKAAFDRARATLPRIRLARVPSVVAGLARGDYRDLSSQRQLDAVRDLLQPA